MRILITGSSGLVGAELAASLRACGHEVVEYDIARARAEGAVEDIRDLRTLGDRMRGCDGVFHLAAVSRVAWGERDPDRCHSVNVEGTRRVIEAALAAPARPLAGLCQLARGLWRPRHPAGDRGRADDRGQPLWQVEGRG